MGLIPRLCLVFEQFCLWLDGGVAVLPCLERSVGHGHEASRFLQPFPVGHSNFLHVSLPRLFQPESRVERLSDHGRYERVLPCLLVLLSSPLLTLVPTAESTVFANLFVIRLRRGEYDNLSALYQFVRVPAYPTLPFRSLCILTRGFESHRGHHNRAWPPTGSWCRSGEGGPGGLVLVS